MKYFLSKNFEKSFKKMPRKIKDNTINKLEIFINDPMDESLNNHSLSGKFSKYRSINISGDIRAIYKTNEDDMAIFIDTGSHSKLYS
jgi:addiction module RelE/StbE family toxin